MDWLRSPAARYVGIVLSVAALVWLALEVRSHWQDIDTTRVDAALLWRAGGLAFAYGLALLLLARNWRALVLALSAKRPSERALLRSYTDSQIAKYLPGNVAHLVGRHLLLAREGVAHGALGRAVLAETLLLLVGAGVAASLALLVLPGPTRVLGIDWRAVAVLPVIAAVLFLLLGPRLLPEKWRTVGRRLPLLLARTLLFMLILGGTFWLLLDGVAPGPPALPVAAALAAWVVGFLTPGSPGGLGTREATIALILGPTHPIETLLLALALFRVVTVLGDLVCWAAGRTLRFAPTAQPA